MRASNALRRIWSSALLLCILPFIILCYYTHPSIHDGYLTANSILKVGRVNFISTNYFNWTGRYTELFLKSAFSPLTYQNPLLLEKVLTASIITSLSLSLYVACITMFGKNDGFKISLLFMVMFIAGLTNIGSVFYWFGGYTAYTAGIIFSILFIGFLYRLKNKHSKQDLFFCCLLVFLATGCYDAIMMIMLWVTFSNVVYSKIAKKGLVHSIILFIVNFASALISILSPGNAARAAGISGGVPVFSITRLLISALKSLFFALGTTVSWLDSILLVLGTLILLQLINNKRNIRFFSVSISPLMAIAWVIIGISISVFPSVLAYQAVWEHTWQCVYFFFLAGWILLANLLFEFLDNKYNIRVALMHRYTTFICQAGFISIVFLSSSSNVNSAYLDLLKAPEYQRRALHRDFSMQQKAREKRMGTIQPLFLLEERYMIPKTLYTVEYNEADAHAFAAYQGVDSVDVNPCYLLK